ncbi:peptidylprolyl isomerase [Paenibacillus chungangensis]|uniref:peptidylprolyl isomerase n=1 Tax=Paenibacillus chungangensis TaxID=696535 RepID=A0ABW3HRB9_9BACL
MNRKRKLGSLVAAVVSLGVIAAFVIMINVDGGSDTGGESRQIIAYINSRPVVTEEVELIASYADNPEAIISAKVVQQEAMRYGLLKEDSYAYFLSELQAENKRRERAIANDDVIYGPRQYTEQSYYHYRQANLFNQLKSSWIESEGDISEEALHQYFETNREQVARKHDSIIIHKVTAALQEELLSIETQIANGASFMEIYHARDESDGGAEVESISDENYREVSKYRSQYYDAAVRLQPGEVSVIIPDGQSYAILYCAERVEGGYFSFNEIREEVIHKYWDEEFEAHIQERSSSAEVQWTELNQSAR